MESTDADAPRSKRRTSARLAVRRSEMAGAQGTRERPVDGHAGGGDELGARWTGSEAASVPGRDQRRGATGDGRSRPQRPKRVGALNTPGKPSGPHFAGNSARGSRDGPPDQGEPMRQNAPRPPTSRRPQRGSTTRPRPWWSRPEGPLRSPIRRARRWRQQPRAASSSPRPRPWRPLP